MPIEFIVKFHKIKFIVLHLQIINIFSQAIKCTKIYVSNFCINNKYSMKFNKKHIFTVLLHNKLHKTKPNFS